MKRHEAGFLNHEPDFEEQLAVALERCEAALFGALRQQLEAGAFIGAQLSKIREHELYRAAGCETFELYCRKFLFLNRAQVSRSLDMHEVVETIRAADLELPANQAQAIMLARIPQEKLIFLWRTVIAYCAREEAALSDAVVRRAVRFEIVSEQLASSSESSAAEKAEKSPRGGVKVTLKFNIEDESLLCRAS